MITVKATVSEFAIFSQYLDSCITGEAKTIDRVKEYFMATSLDNLNKRLKSKLADIEIKRKKISGPTALKIEDWEILSLSIFFNRYHVHTYIQQLENDILNQMPTEIINILNPVRNENIKNYLEESY